MVYILLHPVNSKNLLLFQIMCNKVCGSSNIFYTRCNTSLIYIGVFFITNRIKINFIIIILVFLYFQHAISPVSWDLILAHVGLTLFNGILMQGRKDVIDFFGVGVRATGIDLKVKIFVWNIVNLIFLQQCVSIL